MGAYGVHPTRYGRLSNEQLYSMFRESTYSKLGENEKLDLLQETVNRDALERGEIGAPEVRFADLPANESGNAANGVINVNYDMAVRGVQAFTYHGQRMEYTMSDYNCQTLNTVLHENVHCFQDQVIDGTIHIEDAALTNAYQANGFTSSAVLQNGSYHLGSQYLTGETANGYYMYYFQATERDAHLAAEEKTAAILHDLSDKYGTEASFEAYAGSIAATGYQATEREAVQRFQNPNFVKDLNQTLQNQYFGTKVPVNPNTERAVRAEMVATHQSLQQMAQTNHFTIKEDTKMAFDPKPVSLEEYNQSLRDTVNAYYEHAMRDPSMSKEEAIQSTAEVSEQYLGAVQEFQEAQDMTNTAAEVQGNEAVSAETDTAEAGVSDEGGSGGIDNDGDGVDDGMDV
ncbi:MAG: hypothetical protein ACOYBL_09745 [Lachnospiraceae bacterium]|jgi:hypothetical protein